MTRPLEELFRTQYEMLTAELILQAVEEMSSEVNRFRKGIRTLNERQQLSLQKIVPKQAMLPINYAYKTPPVLFIGSDGGAELANAFASAGSPLTHPVFLNQKARRIAYIRILSIQRRYFRHRRQTSRLHITHHRLTEPRYGNRW